MSLRDIRLLRRSFLLAPLAAAAAMTLGTRPAAAQEKATLLAKSVNRVPEAPDDAAWDAADVLPIPMAPQAVVKPRLYEAGVTSVTVRALYDADHLALLFEWDDARVDARDLVSEHQHHDRDADDDRGHEDRSAHRADDEERDRRDDDAPDMVDRGLGQARGLAARVIEAAPADEERPDLKAERGAEAKIGGHRGKSADGNGQRVDEIHVSLPERRPDVSCDTGRRAGG